MKQYRTILLASIAVLLSACTKDIEYKGPDGKRMLILNSITEAGNVPVIEMSNSAFFLDSYYSGNIIKTGVDVQITINGQTGNANYSDSLKGFTDGRALNQGDVISVTATHPEFGTISATDTVPTIQGCSNTTRTKQYVPAKTMSEMFDDYVETFDDDEVDSVFVVELEIGGRADKTDYYILSIEPTMTYYKYNDLKLKYDTITENIHYKVPSNTKILLGKSDAATAVLEETEADSQFEYGKTSYIFDDLYIKDGSKVSFDILMQKPDTLEYIYVFDDSYGIPVSDFTPKSIADKISEEVIYKANIKLYVLSDAYYYYHISVKDFSGANNTFMSEPVTILHNIKGGAGILGTYATNAPDISYEYRNWK